MGKWDVIKEKWLKKDVMLIMVLTGVLLLVISWPIGAEQDESRKESGEVPVALLEGRDYINMNPAGDSLAWTEEDVQALFHLSFIRHG